MSINATFAPQVTSRMESAARTEATPRPDEHDKSTVVGTQRAPTHAGFSALLALLAGAGTRVHVDLTRQVPPDGISLLDTLLDGSTRDADATGDSGLSPESQLPALATSSQRVVDALRYGILNDRGAGDDTTDLDALRLALNEATNAVTAPSPGRDRGELSRLNEVISRIVTRRGASIDQLKARGDTEAADVRAALDALLASAGTTRGQELSGATDLAAVSANAAAAATALVNARVTSTADVTTPVRTVDALAPELRDKLRRVVERMKQEYGHDVHVVETARSQERQDFLYEQGRARAGAVVTWTRDSAHTRGEAVDVVVDGTWSNADGFARLQRIAREEGLRTLGIRDPGHLELATAARPITGVSTNEIPAQGGPPPAQRIATEATQSGIARVAGTAGVAGIARIASTGGSRGLDRANVSEADRTTAAPAASTIAAGANGPASDRGLGNAFGRGERDEQGRPLNNGRRLGEARRESPGATELSAFGALHANTASATSQPGDGITPTIAVDAASRVADVQQARDSAPAGSVSRMTLNVDTADGGQDRITVDLRGASVGTQIHTDAGNAEQLRLRTAELQDALGRHGLESDSVRITSAARGELTDVARLVGSERDGARLTAAQHGSANDGATGQGQRDRAATAREWDRPESSRQSRGERESARQGAGQRGQRDTPNGSAS